VGSPIGTSSDRPINVERIRRSWEAGECAARGPAPTRSGSPIVERGEVASRERRVKSYNSEAFGQAEVETPRDEIEEVRVWRRAESGSCSCR
jgi:hypothetical protein